MAGAGRLAVLALALTVQAALAEAPTTSLRPEPRGGAVEPAVAQAATAAVIRPQPRPAMSPAAAPEPPRDAAGLTRSIRPFPRPQNFAALLAVPRQQVAPAPPQAAPVAPAPAAQAGRPRRGLIATLFGGPRSRPDPAPDAPRGTYVCGDRAIIGRELEPIGNPGAGCGVAAPVSVASVDGIVLSQAATMDCTTARALHRWIDEGLRPAFRGREPTQLIIAAHYICRSRNNRPGAPISEHGRGRAIDIAAIVFADGSDATVADDYGRALRRAHRAACGIFGTTLGPGSDGFHENHLHFDTAQHRNGPHCR